MWPLNEEISKCRYDTIHNQLNLGVLAKFMEIGKAKVTKPMCGVHHEKNLHKTFLGGPWSDLDKIFTGSYSPQPPAKFRPVSEKMCMKMFFEHYNIGTKPIGF